MKAQWDSLKKNMALVSSEFTKYVQSAPDPASVRKAKPLVATFNRFLAAMEEFDKVVEPVAPLSIVYPFESEAFVTTWTYYKEYLQEQHQRYLYSRAEQIMLNKLKKWSANKQDVAIEILEFLIINRYPSFFKPNDKQLQGEELPPQEQSEARKVNMNINKKDRV